MAADKTESTADPAAPEQLAAWAVSFDGKLRGRVRDFTWRTLAARRLRWTTPPGGPCGASC